MQLKVHWINSLPANPFGAFKIGAELTVDSQLHIPELEAMAAAYGVTPDQLWINKDSKIVNPFAMQYVMTQFVQYVHNEQYKLAANLPGQVFSLPQVEPRR